MGSDDVTSYAIQPDHSLVPVPGGPFPCGGVRPLPIEVGDSGFVYVGNQFTRDIGILQLEADGSLSQAHPPVPAFSQTAGAQPLVLTLNHAGNLLFVSSSFSIAKPIEVFLVAADGGLFSVGEFQTGSNASAVDLIVDPTGTVLFAPIGKRVEVFAIDPTGGTLTAMPTASISIPSIQSLSNGSARGAALSGDGQFLYTASHVVSQTGTIDGFQVGAGGDLTSLSGFPLSTQGQFPNAIEASSDGALLYALNAFSDTKTIVSFAVQSDGTLAPIGGPTPLPGLDFFHFPSGMLLLE